MKKIIIAITACFVCLAANAKSLEELTAEFRTAYATSWEDTVKFVQSNDDEIKAAWETYKSSDEAKKQVYDASREMFSISYCAGVKLTGSDWTLFCLNSAAFIMDKDAQDPTFYANLKSGGWILEGNKLKIAQQGVIALTMKDFSYFMTAPSEAFSNLYWENGYAFKFFANNLLALENPSEAKVICNKIEGVLLLQEKNAKALTQIQALQKALTARILDAKLIK